MFTRSALSKFVVVAATLTLFPACGSSSSDDTGTSADSTSSTGTGTEAGDGDGDTSGDGDGDSSSSEESETTAEPPMDQPDGASCAVDMECASGKCFQVPVLGGLCGECTSDADCDGGGCSIPNPLAGTGSVCNDGSVGGGCETDDVCQDGLTCELILDVSGIIVANTCSTCGVDTDCADGELCTINYDVANFTGDRSCVSPGTVPDGEGCDLATTGDMACESGLCAEVDIMGLAQLGVCGVCAADEDCATGETCQETNVDITTGEVTPAACVAG